MYKDRLELQKKIDELKAQIDLEVRILRKYKFCKMKY